MDLSGSHHFHAAREAVWRAFYNPDALRRTLPNCREFNAVGDGEYSVKLALGFAFLKSVYTGSVKLSDVNPPHSYTLTLSGRGPLGRAKGMGHFTLEPSDDGLGTLVCYLGSVQVAGKVGALGHAVVKAGAQLAIGQFFAAMEREVRRADLLDERRKVEDGNLAVGY